MHIICWLLSAYVLVIIARMLLSWFPISYGSPMVPVSRALAAVTDPILVPLRRAIPPLRLGAMGLDLSPLIVIFGIFLVQGIIC